MSHETATERRPSHVLDGDEVVSHFESWTTRRALEVVLDEALTDREIVAELSREGLRANDAKEAVLGSESALAQVRIEQDRVERSGAVRWGPALRSLSPGQVGWLLVAASMGTGYLSLLRGAWAAMPLHLQLFAIVGLVSVLLLSGRVVILRVPDLLGSTGWQDIGTAVPHEAQFGLGDRHRFVLTEIVLPELRDFIRDNRKLFYGTRLTYHELVGLFDEDESKIVHTNAARRLRRIVERADSGAVALAGYRGVGKTTSIRSMERGLLNSPERSAPLVVVASAPAHYEARDFVLHLHALLCKSVISKVADALGQSRSTRSSRRKQLLWSAVRRSAGFLLFVIIGGAVATMLWGTSAAQFLTDLRRLATVAANDFPASVPGVWSGQPTSRILALGVVVVVALRVAPMPLGLTLSGIYATLRRRRQVELVQLLRTTEKQLDRIRFLQTYTTGWSGKLSMPLKGEAGRTWSTQRAEQQLTHPEVVDQFREFAKLSAEKLSEQGVTDRLVIAIDELDKIGEPEKAHQFVNDVKGVFGVPGCLFFVSVSDDAVLNFEQRGLAVRDAFDSAFTEMIRLEHFTLYESRLWISLRVVEIPEQFCYLCHCLSGGLPRDLKRYTIEMVDVTKSVYQPSLATVTETLVGNELANKAHAFSGVASTLEQTPELFRLSADLQLIPDARSALELAELADRLVQETAGDLANPVNRLRWHSGCFALFCATILEVFDDELTDARLTADLHRLAVARRQMAMYPQLAWHILLDFRQAYDLETSVRPGV
jgi:hypothetical protein